MATFYINTNKVSPSLISEQFASEASIKLAQLMGVPNNQIVVCFLPLIGSNFDL
jgi:hypothetical protein